MMRIAQLLKHAWPGNIRELENMIERAVVLNQGGPIDAAALAIDPRSLSTSPAQHLDATGVQTDGSDDIAPMDEQVVHLETRLIQAALRKTGDNKSAAARLLEISERSLWYKIKKYGI